MRLGANADWIGVVEATYALERADDAWLQGIADAIQPGIDVGLGVQAWRYDFRDPQNPSLGPLSQRTSHDWVAEGPTATFEHFGNDVARKLYTTTPAVTTGRRAFAAVTGDGARFEATLPGRPVSDFLSLRSSPTELVGVLVGAPAQLPITLSASNLSQLGHITAHLGAGFRLREGIRREEAVLRADGRVEHAEGDARDRSLREALRDAARRMDRARGRLRARDPWDAVSMWQALVSGRWSLVDRFDTDGRRYLVAMRNPLPRAELRALTPREAEVVTLAARGLSSKLVAYHLGTGESTASTLLARALRKLGIGRAELPQLAEIALAGDGEGPPTPTSSRT